MAKSKGWQPLSLVEQQEIARRYASGETLEMLGTAYHRGKPALRKVLLEAGVTIRPKGYAKGTEWSPEHRAAHRAGVGTLENRERARKALLQRLPSMRGPATNTAIERRLHDALMKAGIGFTAQSLLLGRHLVDIELHQSPIVIEADGAQHTLRDQKAKDAVRDAALQDAGYRVFRFTGREINADAVVCIQRVIDACGLTPDREPAYDIRTGFAGELHPFWKGGKQEFTCDQCGEPFLAQPKHRRGPRYFCSAKCYGLAQRGRKISAEHRAKIVEGMERHRAGERADQIKI